MQTNIKAQSLRYDIGNTHGNDSLRLNQVDWGHHAAAKSLQLSLTLCDPIDGSPPDSPVPGILQARILEWVANSFSDACKWSRSVVSDCSWPSGLGPTRLLCPWDFPGKSPGVGGHCLLRRTSDASTIVIFFTFPRMPQGTQRGSLRYFRFFQGKPNTSWTLFYKLLSFICIFFQIVTKLSWYKYLHLLRCLFTI